MKTCPVVDREERTIHHRSMMATSNDSNSKEACQITRTELDAAEKITKRLSPLQYARRPLQAVQVFLLNHLMIPTTTTVATVATSNVHQQHQQHDNIHNNNSETQQLLLDRSTATSEIPSRNTPKRNKTRTLATTLFLAWLTWTFIIPPFVTDTITSLLWNTVMARPSVIHHYVWNHAVLHPEWHPTTRAQRFPSVDDRIQDYMGEWYSQPPCWKDDNEKNMTTMMTKYYERTASSLGQSIITPGITTTTIALQHNVIPDAVFVLDESIVRDCARSFVRYYFDQIVLAQWLWQSKETKDRVTWRMNMRVYCGDCLEFFHLLQNDDDDVLNANVPILVQSGDRDGTTPNVGFTPVFKKFRRLPKKSTSSELAAAATTTLPSAATNDDKATTITTCRSQPPPPNAGEPHFIWKLNSRRHFHPLYLVPFEDTQWEKKKNIAIWRGAVTGFLGDPAITSFSTFDKERLCLEMVPRCQFVYNNADSALVDAKFHKNVNAMLPRSLHGVPLFAKAPLSKRQLMSHKAIIILEGNDVSSALKWALFSSSVVIMPPPTTLSWALEYRLQAWVHYVPLSNDTNGNNSITVEERMAWVLEHEQEARKISERATLFIYDLLFHPDAMADDRTIKKKMMVRYQQYFQKV